MIDFLVPLGIALFGGGKTFCHTYCGRGQLFERIGGCKRCNSCAPRFLSAKWFRFGFLAFFLMMFGSILVQTYLVAVGAKRLNEAIRLLWAFRVPWNWAYAAGVVPDWTAQFGFGFYSLMLTSTLIGLIVMALYKPRRWCAFCPMGTMTQMICRLREGEKL